MAKALVRGVGIEYEVLGNNGPWVLLVQGNRQDKELFRPLGEHLSSAGYRVLMHDRRSSGGSEISFEGEGAEDEILADDMHELCRQLDALPVIACGAAGGSRQSILLTLRHAGATRGLLFWWPSGGRAAAESLAKLYYTDYIEIARKGGMQAVAETPFYAERIRRDPENRQRLLKTNADDFIDTLEHWRESFLDGADSPVIGVTEETLRTIELPACIVPGYDLIHPREIGEGLAEILRAEMHTLPPQDRPERDEARARARLDHQRRLADTFIPFLQKHWPS